MSIRKYLFNCFLLLVPVIGWDILFASRLPAPFQSEIFQSEIPLAISIGEHIFRVFIFLLAFLMPISIKSPIQKVGIILYAIGLLAYFASWLLLIYYPESSWSKSCQGFMAPAYTPALWLAGIALIGKNFYFRLPYGRWIFIALAVIFLILHNIHTGIVCIRIQE